ncbi:hypothetical protein [Lacinutrix undariae]
MIKNYITFIVLIALFVACKNDAKKEIPYFEGDISLSESRGLYGSLFKIHTTYTLSENYLKREQSLGGVNSVFNVYSGIIIDLEKDSIVLYHVDKSSSKKNKHTVSIHDFKTNPKYQNFPTTFPSPVDHTFKLLPSYEEINRVNDSTLIKKYNTDYTLYNDTSKILKQEVFDTKDVKIKRELLEMVITDIPDNINFVLQSNLRTTITDIKNDSIVNGEQSKAVNGFLRDIFNKNDEKTDLQKIASNKWVKIGLNILKKSVDLNIHITSEIDELKPRKILSTEFNFPSLDFIEISDIDDFIDTLPTGESIDFDD